jgi:hypothetical protein
MSRHYSWSAVSQKAELETDPSKLQDLVIEAENIMFERSIELTDGGGGGADAEEELRSLRAAVSELLKIKTDRLKWPTFGPTDQ